MMSGKRVVITRSNPVAPDPRVEKTAHSLALAGYQVTVIAWDRTGKLPKLETRRWGRLQRQPIRARFGKGLLNLPQLLRWQVGLLEWLLSNRTQYDVIHACDFDTVLPAWLCSLATRKHVVYDVFDFYAEMLRATPDWIKRIIRRVDLWIMGQVDAVVLADEARREQIRGSHPRRLIVVYNTPDEDPLDPAEPSPPRTRGTRLHLAFVGLLQVERGLLELAALLAKHPEWSLDLAGFGGDEDLILGKVRDLANVRFHGRVSYEVSLAISRGADALVATYDPSIPNHRFASPNKLFEAMMLGKPVIVAAGTGMDKIVQEAGCGLVVPYGDASALEAALSSLADKPDLRSRLGREGRKAYEAKYNWAAMQERLWALYADLGRA